MRPLTDRCPKPLLTVRGKPLIAWHLDALARAGHQEVVVNTAWLGEQIETHCGERHESMRIRYSREGLDFGGALETAGGIARALPLLDEVFWVVAADVYVPGFGFPWELYEQFASSRRLAHLLLVANPSHNLKGDFALAAGGMAANEGLPRYTYSTIGLYRKGFFSELPAGNPAGLKAALGPMLRAAIEAGCVSAQLYGGPWADVGTPERLAELNANYSGG